MEELPLVKDVPPQPPPLPRHTSIQSPLNTSCSKMPRKDMNTNICSKLPVALSSQQKSSPFEAMRVHFAVNNRDLTQLRKLIEHGLNLDYKVYNHTPLMIAILKNEPEIVATLLDGGARYDIPASKKQGSLAIHLACKGGNIEIVKDIINHGCSPESEDYSHATPIHWAAFYGHLNVVQYLVDKGVNVNCLDNRHRTPLFNAVENGHLDIIIYLRQHGTDFTERDDLYWTPLYLACVYGHYEIVQYIIGRTNACCINCIDVFGHSLLYATLTAFSKHHLQIATRMNFDFVDRLFIPSAGSKYKACNNHMGDNKLKIVAVLVDAGAKLSRADVEDDRHYFAEKLSVLPMEVLNVLASSGIVLFLVPLSQIFDNMKSFLEQIGQDDQLDKILLLNSCSDVISLKALTKFKIRWSLTMNINAKIDELPLPMKLKQFCKV